MRFNHVTLDVADLERSKAFYTRLGLIQIVDAPPRYARFRLPEGDATLSVEVMGDRPGTPPDRAQLFFECEDLDATGIPTLDAAAALRPAHGDLLALFFRDDTHLTAAGNRALAAVVATFIETRALLPAAQTPGGGS